MPAQLTRIDEVVWELPAAARADMRVPARVFADSELLDAIARDDSLEQLQNVATLPGIVEAAIAMPDIHQGYGFPVGTVAATALPDGVVSPGGVGYDINCGVRLLALPLSSAELGERKQQLVHELARAIPAGIGRGAGRALAGVDFDAVLVDGPCSNTGVMRRRVELRWRIQPQEIERLSGLGATVVETKSDAERTWTVMRDRESNPFCVE